jgi:transposase
MTYFYKKRKKGKMYLYQGNSKYRDGKSVRVKSHYVGLYDDLSEYFQHADTAIQYQLHFEYGLSHTMFEVAKQLGMLPIFQRHLKKKMEDPFLSKRIMMMVINRLVCPCAKYSIEKWYSKSNLCNIAEMPASELESQKVYRAMDKLDESSTEIETALCKVIGAQEGISFRTLYLDFTNQESYSRNYDSELLDYGHNKRGKDDLYQVNISLCCDVESGVPFFHKTYAGNQNDKQFIHEYAKELRERLDAVGWHDRNTLVIDRGINGKDNFDLLLSYNFDYLGGIIEREFPQYFKIPKYELKKRYTHKRETKHALRIRYTSKNENIYGRTHRVVIFYNQENCDDKLEKIEQKLASYQRACERRLADITKEISKNTFQSAWNNVEKIKKNLAEMDKHLYPLLSFKIESYRFELTWSIRKNEKALHSYVETLGKHVLFTNKLNLTDKEILGLFFGKDKIEKNFEFLKSNAYTNRFIVLGPMLHSKDQRISSHVYTCIMALQIYQIIRYRLKKTKLALTTQQALEELEDITCYYTKIVGKEEAIRHINPKTDLQKKILQTLQVSIS